MQIGCPILRQRQRADDRQIQPRQRCFQFTEVQFGIDSVPCLGVIERESQQFRGRQRPAGAGPARFCAAVRRLNSDQPSGVTLPWLTGWP